MKLLGIVALIAMLIDCSPAALAQGYPIYSVGVGAVTCKDVTDNKVDSIKITDWAMGAWTMLNALPMTHDHLTGQSMTQDQIMEKIITVCFDHPDVLMIDAVVAGYANSQK